MSKIKGMPKGFKTYTVGTLQKRSKTDLAKLVHAGYHVIADLNTRLEMCTKELPVTTEDTFNPIVDQQEKEIDDLKERIRTLDNIIEMLEEVNRPWWKFW